ncbi:MAG TPA: porin [Blastocatellia bacterium]|nr:porin [Blastocatellia bacterium]
MKPGGHFRITLAFALLVFSMPCVPAQDAKKREVSNPGKEPTVQIEQLRGEVEQLRAIVEEQRQVILEIKKQTDDGETKRREISATASSSPARAQLSNLSASTAPPAGSKPASQDKPAVVAGWDSGHAFLRSTDGNFETNITGYVQFDGRGYQEGNHPANTFLVRRARLAAEGKLFRYFDYKVQADLADTNGTLLRDAYVNVHRIDALQFRFGHFKEPFSQEELRSSSNLDFVERSLANNLAPSRSPGLMVSGVINKGTFEYQAGLFNGKGLQALNTTSTPEGVLRLRATPWKASSSIWLRGLSFGGAVARGRSQGGLSIRGQSESRSFTFFTPEPVAGKITRANGEVSWLAGPASFRAEYDQTSQGRENLGPGGTNLPGVVGKAYMAQFTYLITGEYKTDTTINPRRNLFGDGRGDAGFGAWELKARYSNLQISDSTARSNRADSFYFGTNWYLNRFVRHVVDFGIERFKDPPRSPRPGDRNYFVVMSRIQVAF